METSVSASRVRHPLPSLPFPLPFHSPSFPFPSLSFLLLPPPTPFLLTKPPSLTDVIMAREVKTTHNFGEKPYLGFEHVTLVPLCRNLIDSTLLTPRERDWLNAYHAEVLEKTRSYFEEDERALRWVERETRPL